MKDYEEIEELAAIIKEIREDYTHWNKSWQHSLRPSNMKGGLNTYLANQLYEKGYRKDNANE